MSHRARRSSSSREDIAMLVTILPFFLVANVVIDDPRRQSEWEMYGPKCTYDILVDIAIGHENSNACIRVATDLTCRPKGEDSLSCQLEQFRLRRPKNDSKKSNCTTVMDSIPADSKLLYDRPFEVRFNSRGVQNLVVDASIPREKLLVIKDIVSHLHVGFGTQESRNRFTIMEGTMAGQCEIDVKMVRGKAESAEDDDDDDDNDDDAPSKENFQIGFASSNGQFTEPIEKKVWIDKIRDPEKCSQSTFFFNNFEDFNFNNGDVHMNMIASASYMKISKDKFMTNTISEANLKIIDTRFIRLHQNLQMTLKRIEPARHPLPEIPNPAATSIFAFSSLSSIPANA